MAVESTIVFAALIVVLFITFHVTFLFLAREAADDAAGEALEVVTELGGSSADAEAVASQLLDGDMALADWDLEVTEGDVVVVRIDGSSRGFVPFLSTDVTRELHGPKERFIAEAAR